MKSRGAIAVVVTVIVAAAIIRIWVSAVIIVIVVAAVVLVMIQGREMTSPGHDDFSCLGNGFVKDLIAFGSRSDLGL